MSSIRTAGLLFALAIAVSGCDVFGTEKGCTDSNALNYEASAGENDGSCNYSNVIFYKAVDGPPVEVTVDGNSVGTVTAFYPNGPGNCSAPGNAFHTLGDGDSHDWNAIAGPFLSSGTVRANRSQDCIRVRVF